MFLSLFWLNATTFFELKNRCCVAIALPTQQSVQNTSNYIYIFTMHCTYLTLCKTFCSFTVVVIVFWHALNFLRYNEKYWEENSTYIQCYNATTQKKERFARRDDLWINTLKAVWMCICVKCESIKKLQSSGSLCIKSACTYLYGEKATTSYLSTHKKIAKK